MNTASDLLGPKLAVGEHNAPGICWSTVSALNCLLPCLESIHQNSWTQHVTDPTRNCEVLSLKFTTGVTTIQKFTEASLSEEDYLSISCSIIMTLLNTIITIVQR